MARILLQVGVVAEQAADQTVDYIVPGEGDVTVTRERPAGAGEELEVKASGSRVTVSGGTAGARYSLTRGDQAYRIRFVAPGTPIVEGKKAAPATTEKAAPVPRRW